MCNMHINSFCSHLKVSDAQVYTLFLGFGLSTCGWWVISYTVGKFDLENIKAAHAICLHDLLWGETVFTVFSVLLVFFYHLAEPRIDPTATPNLYPISSSCPRPPFSHNCYPPKILSEDDSNSFPPKREVPQLPHVCKGPGKGQWEGRVAGMALRWKVKRPGPRWSKAGLWPKLEVMGTLLKLWAEKCYFLAYVWWYHTGCSTKNGDARRHQRQRDHSQNSGSIWRPAQ